MGHLLKIKCVDSRVNVHILASTCVPFTLTSMQVPNLALTDMKGITVYHSTAEQIKREEYQAVLLSHDLGLPHRIGQHVQLCMIVGNRKTKRKGWKRWGMSLSLSQLTVEEGETQTR
jgi:hypothetical protein